MFSRKKLAIVASTICMITVALFLQICVFANQTQTTAGDFTVEAEAYDVFYDCNRDGKVDMIDIFGCILRYGTEGDPVRIGYLSVPPTAFNPSDEILTYQKSWYLRGWGPYFAEVYLPQGANVTWMAVYLLDDESTDYVHVQLIRENIQTSQEIMAEVNSGTIETPGTVKIVDDTINNPIINNNGYVYHLRLFLTTESMYLHLHGVIIGYEYTL